MIKKYLSAFILAFIVLQSRAQDTIPHLTGKVAISITKGTIECDLTLSNIPRISDYYIRLNSGMNIRYMKNPAGLKPLNYEKSRQDTLSYGESNAYFIPAYNNSRKFLPRSVRISYVGMYPVITDTASAEDWKGNIAFNGKSLRTDGGQSAWYPVLYDVKKDVKYDKVTYNIEVNCADCKVIYVNGSEPVNGTHAILKSDVPQELTMFSGDFKSAFVNGNYFLNPDMDDTQLASFEEMLYSYKSYYEKHLLIPYKGNAVYVQTTPVSKNNAWLFASYPTIVNIGFEENGMRTFLDKKKGDGFKPYMAHELGHYYFGAFRRFNSALGDMISEGFSEFLALHITRQLISDSLFQLRLRSKLRSLNNFKPTFFEAIRSKSDYDNRELYVYYYAPLIFTAIEKEIGEQKMWEWMRSLLLTPASFTNYHFMEQTLGDALKDKQKLDLLRQKYFSSANSVENAAKILGISNAEPSASIAAKQSTRTFYYFFFSGPMVDAGAPENKTIRYTDVHEITCSDSVLSAMAQPVAKRIKDECENEGGCSSDFNIYQTMEQAKARLQHWLKPYLGNAAYVIKMLNP